MRTIRIVISGGTARVVEIRDTPKHKHQRSIPALLRSMPKALLAKALNISSTKEDGNV